MQRLYGFVLHPLTGKVFLCVLISTYAVYLVAGANFLSSSLLVSSIKISEHVIQTNSSDILRHWTVATMNSATDADESVTSTSNLTQGSTNKSPGKSVQQPGQPPRDKSLIYPLSTVGKVFFTNAFGQDSMCSGTAVTSRNGSVVDTAGHCLYWYGDWVHNMVFCPLYDHGNTPYGCWAARDLEVPSDWIDAKPNDFHHDFGIAIVSPNSQGTLTDVVGGAGWAYNQRANQPFYAYGYPAGYPFDGQTRASCEDSLGTLWPHGEGSVISIPCDMTGGSSGGPWFILIKGNWYLNGHNDFISSMQPNHMFSPYYDATWYALYNKAQQE